MKHIVKRAGHLEAYDERKLYASVYAAVLAIREPVGMAELVAKEVVEAVSKWLEKRPEVTSNDIRRVAADHLKIINNDAGFQYLHHRIIW